MTGDSSLVRPATATRFDRATHGAAARLVVRWQALAPSLRHEVEHRHRAPHHLLSHGRR